MTLTKLVFLAVIAVLAAVLYTLPAHAKSPGGNGGQSGSAPTHGTNATPAGSPSPNEKALENSNGQFQSERKFGTERAASRKNEKAKAVVPSDERKKEPSPTR